jgi:hypothetical protein
LCSGSGNVSAFQNVTAEIIAQCRSGVQEKQWRRQSCTNAVEERRSCDIRWDSAGYKSTSHPGNTISIQVRIQLTNIHKFTCSVRLFKRQGGLITIFSTVRQGIYIPVSAVTSQQRRRHVKVASHFCFGLFVTRTDCRIDGRLSTRCSDKFRWPVDEPVSRKLWRW